ncbi:MAG: amino acid adenylation domain-containing protein, partial [Pseudomonadota bacterium]|nr:amino acid adenylation domain-containing protein [Pseudomonadota bacterium]
MNGQVLAAPPLAGARPYILTSNADDRPRWREGERLHHVFETTCDANPDGIAVETLSGGLSFAQIEARANQLARYLLTRGLIPGDVVALLFDRSAESYIAMLAVLKIGAAYVPLDPGFPADRIAYIGEDAGVRAVLTMGDFACLGASAAEMLIALDRDSVEIAQMPPTRLTGVPFSSELAYIIYTSGSTGRPKGVAIDHAMIVNFVRVAEECYGYQPGDRVYQGLTLAFDFSVEEIWVPLLAGATLVPNQSGASLVGEDLYDFLKEKRISAMCCVPTLLATVEPTLPDLRLIIVSGEACPADLAARWHQRGRVILNAYGPTETTVTATIARLMPDTPITIGAPLPTYSVAILKPDTAEVLPQGEVGEIAIAGIGVSRGYIGRDDLTAAVFIKDIFGMPENASGRVYRSGDLGRIDDQGRIVYMGRIDTQVKIRGYRIELDEIETVMLQVAGVRQAVVTTYTPEGQETELAAYFTGTITAEKLAGELRRKLPPFMVPAFFEKLDVIPMLPSDKADRKALPAPSGRRLVQEATEY